MFRNVHKNVHKVIRKVCEMKGWKKRIITAMTVLFVLAMFGACGKKEETTEAPEQDLIGATDVNTLEIDSNGRILEIAVEDYTGVDYKPDEVRAFIQNEINSFNKEQGAQKVSFLQMKQEKDVIRTAISYTDISAYNAFNHMELKLTVYSAETADKAAADEANRYTAAEPEKKVSDAELAEAGYDASSMDQSEIDTLVETKAVTATFSDVNGNTVSSDAIDVNENMMLVTDEKMNIRLEDGKLLYANPHAAIENGIAHTDGEGTAIVVLFLGL